MFNRRKIPVIYVLHCLSLATSSKFLDIIMYQTTSFIGQTILQSICIHLVKKNKEILLNNRQTLFLMSHTVKTTIHKIKFLHYINILMTVTHLLQLLVSCKIFRNI